MSGGRPLYWTLTISDAVLVGFIKRFSYWIEWESTSIASVLCCTRVSKLFKIAHICYQTQGWHRQWTLNSLQWQCLYLELTPTQIYETQEYGGLLLLVSCPVKLVWSFNRAVGHVEEAEPRNCWWVMASWQHDQCKTCRVLSLVGAMYKQKFYRSERNYLISYLKTTHIVDANLKIKSILTNILFITLDLTFQIDDIHVQWPQMSVTV